MAWTSNVDETKPADSDLVSGGDDAIRELKRQLNERLATLVNGWPNTDPLTLKAAKLDSAGSTVLASGLIADRPNPPVSDFYLATDEGVLYVKNGSVWVAAGGGGSSDVTKIGYYNTDATAGSRLAGYANATKLVQLYAYGTTDASGDFKLLASELPDLNFNKLVSVTAFGPGTTALPALYDVASWVNNITDIALTIRRMDNGAVLVSGAFSHVGIVLAFKP